MSSVIILWRVEPVLPQTSNTAAYVIVSAFFIKALVFIFNVDVH